MKHLLVTLLCSTALSGCSGINTYHASDAAKDYEKTDDSALETFYRVVKKTTQEEIDSKYSKGSINHAAASTLLSPAERQDRLNIDIARFKVDFASGQEPFATQTSIAASPMNLSDQGGSMSPMPVSKLGINWGFNVVDFGAGLEGRKAEEFAVLSSAFNLDQTSHSVVLGGDQIYIDIANNFSSQLPNAVKHTKEIEHYRDLIKTELDKCKKAVSEPDPAKRPICLPSINPDDLTQISVTIEDSKQRYFQYRQLDANERSHFFAVVGYDVPAKLTPAKPLPVPTLAVALQTAMKSHPAILFAEMELEKAKRTYHSVDASSKGRIDFGISGLGVGVGSVMTSPLAPLTVGNVGFSATLPLNGKEANTRLNIARGGVELAELRYAEAKRKVRQAVEQAYIAYSVPMQRSLVAASWQDYTNGRKDFRSFISALSALHMAEDRLPKAQADAVAGTYILPATQGILLTLQGVASYDMMIPLHKAD